MTDTNEYWWRDHDNVVLTAYWMRDRDYGADDFCLFIEKPWKYTDEYENAIEDYKAEQAAEVSEAEVEEVDIALDENERLQQEFRAGFDEVRPPTL